MGTEHTRHNHQRRRDTARILVAASLLGGCAQAELAEVADAPSLAARSSGRPRGPSFVEGERQLLEIVSDYSRIRVKQEGTLRTLWFVQDQGHEVKETAIDLARPSQLVIPYTRAMFVSHLLLLQPPKRCLIVGLGGGAMVQFLAHHFPQTEVDAVEIDPAVVQIAAEWFGTRPGPRIRLATQDGFLYVKEALEAQKRWDVVYMDAFLKPAEGTDSRGQQLRLKTERFLGDLGRLIGEGGVVVFNMLRGHELQADLRAVQGVFPHVHVIEGWGGNVVVAASFTPPPSASELERRVRTLDERGLGVAFAELARSLQQGR